MESLFEHEYNAFIQYMPNLERIRNHRIHIVVAVGQESGDAYFVQSTRVLAARHGYDYVDFPATTMCCSISRRGRKGPPDRDQTLKT
jgi:hypothetical protein